MAVQPGLCPTWSETPKTGFLRTRLKYQFALSGVQENLHNPHEQCDCPLVDWDVRLQINLNAQVQTGPYAIDSSAHKDVT